MDAGRRPDSWGGEPHRPVAHGRVVVLSGPSAVGKSSVVRRLREQVPDLRFSVSATTRAPRPGEVDGVDYHFVSPGEFQQLIDRDGLRIGGGSIFGHDWRLEVGRWKLE